ncbi:unnamed protein product [Phytophthora lilii]|uniref:Unnamed protein product n=1 Tax=Phytophthora lilii TaxID=2077276 RepID=A0A9W6X5W5_9STRA|nr:unnamed protein product [Phytophthora lilii]
MVKTSTNAKGSTPARPFEPVDDRGHGSGVDEDDEVEMKMEPAEEEAEDGEVDELSVVVGKSGTPRPVARRLDADLKEVASARALAPDERPVTSNRPPVNGDTPSAYRALGQIGRSMTATSAWVSMFSPKEVGGGKWIMLEKELICRIDSSSVSKLAEQTKRLLEAMGFECTALPSKVEFGDVSAELTMWKRKLKDTFGIRGLVTVMKLGEADPRNISLPDTPKKAKSNTQVHGDQEGSVWDVGCIAILHGFAHGYSEEEPCESSKHR